MKQDPYVVFTNAKGNALRVVIAWIGSILGPSYIFIGWGEYNDWPLFVGLGLTLYTLLAIRKGFVALRSGVFSDFVVYSLIPLLIPVAVGIAFWVCGG
ncbi:conserved membrane hypothetical protein [Marinobacter salarius]|nr:conserved membrane hypothetical protein [Marinobacter salarius]VXB61312.1 conserved membrane hypothetical protein [Marinobacter salarius]|tara:strand:- start:542 stop:835 length:294 start_codon:yes stop_codon:yes gene_type:complete